jgi:hypothetical protein
VLHRAATLPRSFHPSQNLLEPIFPQPLSP